MIDTPDIRESEMTPVFLHKLAQLGDFYVGFLTAINDLSPDLHSDFQIPSEDLAFIKAFFDQIKTGNFSLVNTIENLDHISLVISKAIFIGSVIGNISNTYIFRHKTMADRKISIINYHLPQETRKKIQNFHSQINHFFTGYYRTLFLDTYSGRNFSDNVCGFIAGKSYLDHAKAHMQAKTIISIDIKRFYDSIKLKNILNSQLFRGAFSTSASLHNVSDENPVIEGMITLCSAIMFSMANYMTHNGVVPTGAHYSPSFSNFIFARIDSQIINTIKSVNPNIVYTRYADDIAISTPILSIEGNYVIDMNLIRQIEAVVNGHTFYLKYEKTKIMGPKEKKIIAGVIIDQSDMNTPKLSIGSARKLELKNQMAGRKMSELSASEKGTLNWVHQVNESQFEFIISEMISE